MPLSTLTTSILGLLATRFLDPCWPNHRMHVLARLHFLCSDTCEYSVAAAKETSMNAAVSWQALGHHQGESWSTLNVTEIRFIQSPSKVLFKGPSPFQRISIGSLSDGYDNISKRFL